MEKAFYSSECHNWMWRAVLMLRGEWLTAAAEGSFCKLKFNNVNKILSLTWKPNWCSSVSFGLWLPLVPYKKQNDHGCVKQPRLDSHLITATGRPFVQWSNAALRAHLRLSVDQQLPDRQAAASEAGKILIQYPYDQHWSSSGLHSPSTDLLPLHQPLHI